MLNNNTNKRTTFWGISFSTHKNHVDSCIGVSYGINCFNTKYLHNFFDEPFFFTLMWCGITSYEYGLWVVGKKWSRDFIWQKKKIPLLSKNLNMNGHRNVYVYLFIYVKEMYVFSRIFIPFSAFIHMSYFISRWVGFYS